MAGAERWSRRRRWPLMVALAIWPMLVLPGFVVVERYANAPGKLAEAPATWPASVVLDRAADKATLVMLAHPRCPCSRASMRELSRLMAAIDGKAKGFVLFVDPSGQRWEQTDLWASAEGIPGMTVLADQDAEIANALGAYTSGQVLVYDPAGTLVFNGGITPSRGHEGDNLGRSAIIAILNGTNASAPPTNSVFGCDLQEPERAR